MTSDIVNILLYIVKRNKTTVEHNKTSYKYCQI